MWVSTHTKKFDLAIFSSLDGSSIPSEVRLWTQVSVSLGGSVLSSGLLRFDIDHGASKSIWLAGGLVNGCSWAEWWWTAQTLFACLLNLSTDGNALEVSPIHTTHVIGTWSQQEPCFLYPEQEQSRGELATSLRASGSLDAHDPEEVIGSPWDCIIIWQTGYSW